MQAKNGWVIATIILTGLVVFLAGIYFAPTPEPTDLTPLADAIAANVAAKIVIPDNSIDIAKIDRVCELTDGCEYWEPNRWQVNRILRILDNDAYLELKKGLDVSFLMTPTSL